MKKILFKVWMAIFLLNIYSLMAENTVEIRAAAFYPSSHLFREIYGNIGADYQLQFSTTLPCNMELWTNLDWFSKHGKSVGLDDPTRVNIFNASVGLNFLYYLNCRATLYVGAGPALGRIWLKNDTHCEGDEKVSKTAVGGVVKVGVSYALTNCIFVDLFVDYLYQPVHFGHHKHVDIGGFKPGVGLGFIF